MRHLDLFSGIGGFALAVDQVWLGAEHIFCEIDPFCREVLRKNFGEVKIYDDIRTLSRERFIADADRNRQPGWAEKINAGDAGKQAQCDAEAGRRPASKSNGDYTDNIRKSGSGLSNGIICSGLGGSLSNNQTSNVEDIETAGVCIQGELKIWERQPLLSWDNSGGLVAEQIGNGDQVWQDKTKNEVRKVRDGRDIQGREDKNTSTPSRLRKTIEGNLAMPKVPSRMAQKQPSESRKGGIPGTRSADAKRCVPYEGIDLLTGGFP